MSQKPRTWLLTYKESLIWLSFLKTKGKSSIWRILQIPWDNHCLETELWRKLCGAGQTGPGAPALFTKKKLLFFHVYCTLMTLFYRAVVESALPFALVSWYNSLFTEKQKLTFSWKWSIGHTQLHPEGLYARQLQCLARGISEDESHPLHKDFQLFPSGEDFYLQDVKPGTSKTVSFPAQFSPWIRLHVVLHPNLLFVWSSLYQH